MKTIKTYAAIAALSAAVLLTACGGSSPTAAVPTAPVNAQQTVLQTDKLIGDAANTLAHTVATLHQQGMVSDANAHVLDQYAIQTAKAVAGIENIIANGQPWATQKTQIMTYLATITAPAITGQIDPSLSASVAGIGALFILIEQQVVSQ